MNRLPALIALLCFPVWLNAAPDAESTIAAGEQWLQQGMRGRAVQQFQVAVKLASGSALEATARGRLGAALYSAGDFVEGAKELEAALALSDDQSAKHRASLHNDLGLAYEAVSDFSGATDQFRRAISIARASADPGVRDPLARASLNAMRLDLQQRQRKDLVDGFSILVARIEVLNDPLKRADLLIGAADLARSAYWHFRLPDAWRMQTYQLLNEAKRLTQGTDARLHSYAAGHLARLYEDDGRDDEALKLAREAMFSAQAAGSLESLYQWQWMTARILRRSKDMEAARAHYEMAIASLEPVRATLIDGSPWTFARKVGPLYREYADLLLQNAMLLKADARQSALTGVRDLLERSKAAEVEDYFRNQCVLPEGSIDTEGITSETATIYPVILDDRLEVLVSVGGVLHQRTAKVTRQWLERQVRAMRRDIQNFASLSLVQKHAQALYDVLLRPSEKLLEGVDTIVFVPDGMLRTIPFSALHDGEDYLVQRFAVAITLGLQMTSPAPTGIATAGVFAGGISEARQNMVALPGVDVELGMIETQLGAVRMQDKAFTRAAFAEEVGSTNYSVVHVATHGQFSADPRESFLLAYDDKITLNDLESVLSNPARGGSVDLLVLSACQTAMGDDRAALGLAGIALKSGARSAIATLWSISDAATVRMIEVFYDQIARSGVSKARALQTAQTRLIESGTYEHPWQWAPFLLLGNWL